MSFAKRSNKPIARFETRLFAADSRIISEFPKMSYLSVHCYHLKSTDAHKHLQQCQAYDDKLILEIARIEHTEMELPGYFSNPTTLHRLIEIVRVSSHINALTVHVFSEYFHRFLISFELREEAGKLIDFSDSNSPEILFQLPCYYNSYYLHYAKIGYLYIQSNGGVHSVSIVNKRITRDHEPSHPLSFPWMLK
ncbi:hypothetical protein PFISCL1PPCAC_24986 [Pristionchus fissidentatus]|uniref:Uncharacterized protein n=1 Tax=Pristionchus fissidentatus TaxID=1538716 RepID=A0AAV5WSL7_9BILA|nr:hypothetical protein PFISCL1PPCAC_24986 [Pristionchus fissidentatus]